MGEALGMKTSVKDRRIICWQEWIGALKPFDAPSRMGKPHRSSYRLTALRGDCGGRGLFLSCLPLWLDLLGLVVEFGVCRPHEVDAATDEAAYSPLDDLSQPPLPLLCQGERRGELFRR